MILLLKLSTEPDDGVMTYPLVYGMPFKRKTALGVQEGLQELLASLPQDARVGDVCVNLFTQDGDVYDSGGGPDTSHVKRFVKACTVEEPPELSTPEESALRLRTLVEILGQATDRLSIVATGMTDMARELSHPSQLQQWDGEERRRAKKAEAHAARDEDEAFARTSKFYDWMVARLGDECKGMTLADVQAAMMHLEDTWEEMLGEDAE